MSQLKRKDIQGVLLSAYGHLPWSANVLLRIDDRARAQAWLGSLADTVTTAIGKEDRSGTNVAITYPGLVKLGFEEAPGVFPIAFVEGMASARRSKILCDTGASAPDAWTWGTGANAVDILLLLFAHEEAALQMVLSLHERAFDAAGLCEVAALRGHRHHDGKEQFGFSDGIAQPAIRGERSSEPARRRTDHTNDVAAGEFILGYRNEYGYPSESPIVDGATDPSGLLSAARPEKRDFGRNGSYLVLRQLEQDVAKFWRFLDQATSGPSGSDAAARESLAAKFIGRWPSGAPLVKAPHKDDRSIANDNCFGFAADLEGTRCPVGAHIRRANPRDGFANDSPKESLHRSNKHRILRRGRSYGPRIENVLVDDGAERGLHFIALNSDIERQFEFVHQTWLNNSTFCGLSNEVDPLVGAQPAGGVMSIQKHPVRKRYKGLERFVTTKGGSYFFLPSLRALRYLAALAPSPQR